MHLLESLRLKEQLDSGSVSFALKTKDRFRIIIGGLVWLLAGLLYPALIYLSQLDASPNAVTVMVLGLTGVAVTVMCSFVAWSNLVRSGSFRSGKIELSKDSLSIRRRGILVSRISHEDIGNINYFGAPLLGVGKKKKIFIPATVDRFDELLDALGYFAAVARKKADEPSHELDFFSTGFSFFLRVMFAPAKWVAARFDTQKYWFLEGAQLNVDDNALLFSIALEKKRILWEDVEGIAFDPDETGHIAFMGKGDKVLYDCYPGDFCGSSYFLAMETERRGIELFARPVDHTPSAAEAEGDREEKEAAQSIAQIWKTYGIPLHIAFLVVGLALIPVDAENATLILGMDVMLAIIFMHQNEYLKLMWNKYRRLFHIGAAALSVPLFLADTTAGVVFPVLYLSAIVTVRITKL